jgi:hypothetical protein
MFEAGSKAGLVENRNEPLAKGVDATDVVDHDWARLRQGGGGHSGGAAAC